MGQDILFSDELDVRNGDLHVGDADQNHVQAILETMPGQFYQYPYIGVGIGQQLLGSPNKIKLGRNIRTQLESDDFQIESVSVLTDTAGKMGIEINAEKDESK